MYAPVDGITNSSGGARTADAKAGANPSGGDGANPSTASRADLRLPAE
jgi:hypothetical protein